MRPQYGPTESDIPMHGWSPYSDIHYERIRAHIKHQDKPGGSMEQKDWDSPDWLPVVVEEVGEVARAICEHRHGHISNKDFPKDLRGELVQVGAMIAAWIEAIDERFRTHQKMCSDCLKWFDVQYSTEEDVCPACTLT